MIKYKIHFNSGKAITFLRWSIGIIFIWFGMVKFFVGLSPAEDLASSTICTLTGQFFPQGSCMPILAIFESLIGISLLSGKFLKWALGLLFLHMLGTFSTLFIFPEQMFSHFPFVLTMKGQYVMKNIIILAAVIGIWNSTRKMVSIRDDPKK